MTVPDFSGTDGRGCLCSAIELHPAVLESDKTNAQRQLYTKSALWLGLGYGAVVTIALLILSRLYVVWLLHLTVPGDLLQVLPIFCVWCNCRIQELFTDRLRRVPRDRPLVGVDGNGGLGQP